ncbi:YdcF family protein [Staphylococcus sp. ACRSN]|uniref:YdcF family protein n=1 Tax=Staphylococcus sp. ACRSN TaxID=2918214 RepID=UPI001EF3B491|nr:YdcF family protein [Staphylococcus sp. ACRSN]MCG7338179.1 YdcF family protein [Staphylococcus sp. ACRSN]
MNILPLTICLLISVIYIGMTFNIKFFVHINVFISQVILGYIVIIFYIGSHTYPVELIIAMCIGLSTLYVSHAHLLQNSNSKLFLKRLALIILKVVLFGASCAYISLIPIAFNAIFYWLAAITFSTLYTFICYAVCSSSYARNMNRVSYDKILVLGAGIFTEEVTPMLAERLNKALDLYAQNPKSEIIVSGGQGKDEPISEALAMTRYLVKYGVPLNKITMENHSTSTYENIKYTKSLLPDHLLINSKIVCVTSQFHIMRALRFGQKLQLKLTGVGSHTPYHFLEVALIRDFLALMYQYKLILTIYFASLFFICIIALWHIPTF